MPRKFESRHQNKGRSEMQGHGQKAGREEGPGNASASRQQVREEKLETIRDIQQQVREEKSGNASDYRQQIRQKKLAGGTSKTGCLPKLFMLLLPFMTVATLLLLRS
jgi:hypothetical protein